MTASDDYEDYLRHCARHPYARKHAEKMLSYMRGGAAGAGAMWAQTDEHNAHLKDKKGKSHYDSDKMEGNWHSSQ